MNESKNFINRAWSLFDCFSSGTSISFFGQFNDLYQNYGQKIGSEKTLNLPKSFSLAIKALSCSFCCVYLTKLTISKNGYENGANIATITLENISHFLFDSWYDLKRLYQNNLSLISWVKIDIITFNDTLLILFAIINRCENAVKTS